MSHCSCCESPATELSPLDFRGYCRVCSTFFDRLSDFDDYEGEAESPPFATHEERYEMEAEVPLSCDCEECYEASAEVPLSCDCEECNS
jgi:hypothetical protein